MFNSLKYVKQLEEAGVTRLQAEVHLQIMTEIIETNLATKQDIEDLKSKDLRDITVKLDTLTAAMLHGFEKLESKMTVNLGAIVIGAVGALFMLLKYTGKA